MKQSRQALTLSIFYSIPLLIWLSAQLQFIEWNSSSLQQLFEQTLNAITLLQSFAIILLFTGQLQIKWQDDVTAILLIMFFPLPFVSIIWLTGSSSIDLILFRSGLVAVTGSIVFSVQSCARFLPASWWILRTGLSSSHLLLAVLLWNYRNLWLGWSL